MADPYNYDSDTSLQALLEQLYNPYANDIMLAYGYQPSTGTPSITNPGTYVDPDPSGTVPLPPPGVYTPPDPLPPFDPGVDPTPDPPPAPPPNPCPAGYIMGPRGVCILDPTVQPPGYPDPPGEPPPPSGPPTGYVSAANLADYDPFLHGRRNMTSGKQFLMGSRQDVGMDDFLSALAQAEGKYGQGMTYDPDRGLFSNISEEDLAKHRENQAVPMHINPNQMTDVEQLRAKILGNRKLLGGQQVAIGDRMYFLDDGNISSYQYQDVKYDSTPSFARGGAVSPIASNGIGPLFAKGNM